MQSEFALQRRTVSVPGGQERKLVGRCVLQLVAAVHATTMGSLVQLGTLPPPVRVMLPQQTSPVVKSPGDSHELTQPLKTKLKIYELPDWQNATADVQITSPAAQ